MKLRDKIKTSLDETRMLVLGVQIVIGFQFRSAFQEGFDHLPAISRHADAAALMLTLVTIALLIAPGPYHRLVEGGRDSGRLHELVSQLASLALPLFGLALGLALFIAGERLLGMTAGIVAGIGAASLALFFWYGLEFLRRRVTGQKERAMTAQQRDLVEDPPLHVKIDQMLTEARVILPGVQALLGFQLAIVLTAAFERLPLVPRLVHGTALALMTVSVVLLIAPCAYHRLVYAGEAAPEFHRLGSRFITAATVPLALGLAADVYVVVARMLGSEAAGIVSAVLTLALLVAFWHVFPMLARRARAHRPAYLGRHSPSAG